MSNQTVSSNLNLDAASISGLLDGEDITVNSNAVLTINSDNYWSQQAAVIGAISLNPGELKIDGTEVWWIPYDGGTGNVPSLGTVGTPDVTRSGSNVGEFLGVFTALGVSPSAAGGAMPATGFIKLRTKSVTFSDNDVLTFTGGATATVNSTTGGQRGWLNIAVEETQQASASTQTSKITVTGDWFYLANTAGSNNETIQYYVADICPAIQVETSAGSGVYEWWLNAGNTRWGQNNRCATDARGKFFNCSTAGVITFARTAGAITFGQIPPAGAKVRVPNIHISNRTVASWATNVVPNTNPASRWELSDTVTSTTNIDKLTGNWYINTTSSASFTLTNSAYFDALQLTYCASAVTIDVAVGMSDIYTSTTIFGLLCSNLPFGGTVSAVISNYQSSLSNRATTFTDCNNLTFNNCKFTTFSSSTAATLTRQNASNRVAYFTRCVNSTFNNTTLIGGPMAFDSCVGITVNNTTYADLLENTTTSTTNGVYAIQLLNGSNNILIDGFSIFQSLTNVHPYLGILTIGTGSYSNEIRNVGTATTPFNGGSANAMGTIINLDGADRGSVARRCYADNLRTSAFLTAANSSSNAQFIDVWGDAADALISVRGVNPICRGIRNSNLDPVVGSYGVHFVNYWTSTTAGILEVLMNPPSAASIGNELQQVTGTPLYNNTAGTVSITMASSDVIIWEMQYFLRGATAFTNSGPTFSGTATTTKEYQIDTGSGWNGSWKTLNSTNLSGETINSSTGFKLKIRYTCTGAGTVTGLLIALTTTSTDYKTQYDLPGYNVTITGLVSGTEVRAYVGTDPATSTALDGIESSGTSFTFSQSQAGNDGYINIHKAGYKSIYLPITYTAAAVSIPVQQEIDRWYRND